MLIYYCRSRHKVDPCKFTATNPFVAPDSCPITRVHKVLDSLRVRLDQVLDVIGEKKILALAAADEIRDASQNILTEGDRACIMAEPQLANIWPQDEDNLVQDRWTMCERLAENFVIDATDDTRGDGDVLDIVVEPDSDAGSEEWEEHFNNFAKGGEATPEASNLDALI